MSSTNDGTSPSQLIDPRIAEVFNASLNAGTRRAIDLRQDDELDGDAFRQLVSAAAAHNAGK